MKLPRDRSSHGWASPATIRPLPSPARPGRLPRRRRRLDPDRELRVLLIALAIIGAIALVLLILGLLGVHAVTEHLRLH